jgi:hypothetical protein
MPRNRLFLPFTDGILRSRAGGGAKWLFPDLSRLVGDGLNKKGAPHGAPFEFS